MREKLRFVSGHINVNRTIAFAAFACQAKIQGFLNIVIAPAIRDDIAVQHLPKVVRAAASRVPLLVGDHETGAHGVVFWPFTILSAAFANPDAA